MCGILGIIGPNLNGYIKDLELMKKSLSRRGPDNTNHYLGNNFLFIHNMYMYTMHIHNRLVEIVPTNHII